MIPHFPVKLRLLALINVTYFSTIISSLIFEFLGLLWILRTISSALLVVDFFVTISVLNEFFEILEIQKNIFLSTYIVSTLITRIFIVRELLFPSKFDFTFVVWLIGSTSFLLGLVLYSITDGSLLTHFNKLRFTSYVNMTGIVVFFSSIFPNLPSFFLAIKLFLALPTGFIYFIISFDNNFEMAEFDLDKDKID